MLLAPVWLLPATPGCLWSLDRHACSLPACLTACLLRAPAPLPCPAPPPLQCFFPVCIILLFEVNHFFLKAVLWVPPLNPLNTYRLSILFLFALPGIKVGAGAAVRRQQVACLPACPPAHCEAKPALTARDVPPVPLPTVPPVPQEYYEFVEQDSADIFTRLGTFAWLAMAIAFVETLLCVKFGRG